MNGHYELNNDITILDSYNPSNRGGTIIVKIELSLIEILLYIFSLERRMSWKFFMIGVHRKFDMHYVSAFCSPSIIFLCNLFMCIFKWCAT